MRSELVYPAVRKVPNRYLLCQVASKATRMFHRPNTRIQDTMNEILNRIGSGDQTHFVVEQETLAPAQRRAA